MIFGLQVNEGEALLTERTEQDDLRRLRRVIALLLLLRIVGLELAIVGLRLRLSVILRLPITGLWRARRCSCCQRMG